MGHKISIYLSDENAPINRKTLAGLGWHRIELIVGFKKSEYCDSIADLAKIQREEMKELLGPVTGQKLFSFFHKKYDAKACYC